MVRSTLAPALAEQLDGLLAPWNRTDTPGVVVGVDWSGHGRYRHAVGMASLETGVANGIATRMRIGSISKHMLAALVLLLEDEGTIDLDRRIGDYLPELSGHTAEPSVRQLLQHRGGTRCHIDMGFIGHGMLAAPEGSALFLLLRQQGRNFAPGAATIYNNGGYHLVSLAASRLAGAPLVDVLERRLFDPLDMTATALASSDYVMIPGAASLHLPPQDGVFRRGLFPSLEIMGEGGVVSTVDDMLTWISHLCADSSAPGGTLWRRLLDVADDADGAPGYYGLGLMRRSYRGVESFRHSGGVPGGASDMVCVPDEGLRIIVISNGAPGASPSTIADRIVDVLLGPALTPAPAPVLPAAHARWLGRYGSAATGMVHELEDQAGVLNLRLAEYAVPAPMAAEPDGWLATGLTGIGTTRIRCEDADAPTIRLRFAGDEELLTLLGAPDDAAGLKAIAGRYESAESGMAASIELVDGGLHLRMSDIWGTTTFELTPLGGLWLRMRSLPDPTQFGATLWFRDGWSGGFVLNSARTRGLAFERVTTPRHD